MRSVKEIMDGMSVVDEEAEAYVDQFRMPVTPEQAGMAMLALQVHLRNSKPLAYAHWKTLMALAVEKHAPKQEEAQRGAER